MGTDLRWHLRLKPDAIDTLKSLGIADKSNGRGYQLRGVFGHVGHPEYDSSHFEDFDLDLNYIGDMSVIDTMIREHTVFAATFVERDQNTASDRDDYRRALAKVHRFFASLSYEIVLTNDQMCAEEYEVFDDELRSRCLAKHQLLEDFPE